MLDYSKSNRQGAERAKELASQIPDDADDYALALKAIAERLPRAVVIIVLLTNTINILGPILAGKKAVGPSLHGMFGRKAGTTPKFKFSKDVVDIRTGRVRSHHPG